MDRGSRSGAGVQAAPQERTQSGRDCSNIIGLSVSRRKHHGITFYRAPRPPGEVVRCLTEALRREIRVSDELGIHISNPALRDIVAWGERGCLPQ